MVRQSPRDQYLWDGTLTQLKYYVENVWKPGVPEGEELVLDFTRCRVGPMVAKYIQELMREGVQCINSRDLPGVAEVYSDLQEASKGNVKYHYIPIKLALTYQELVSTAKSMKAMSNEYKPEEHDGKEMCFYVKHHDTVFYANTNIVAVNMAYYLLTRLSLNFDPFYSGEPESEFTHGPYNKYVLSDIFRFITVDIGIPPEFYEEGDMSIWVVTFDGLLQKLQYNKDGRLHSETGANMYYYPGFGWYTLADLRRMNMYPLPGFLFVESIAKREAFLNSFLTACMRIRAPIEKIQKSEEDDGSALLKFIETYRDLGEQ